MPHRAFPPAAHALEAADVVLESLDELTPAAIEAVLARRSRSAGG